MNLYLTVRVFSVAISSTPNYLYFDITAKI